MRESLPRLCLWALLITGLDGFVYVFFNGEGYSAIGVTGNYALPPFSAFF
jgi:hypothetical protein